ncbi:hypothetical protein [Paraburkholderia heleia]|uniref:hypothetical protein n=1 Tax=Paraburkholderia heleia TaxID=634127 RepID=UPI0012EED134|nr:hypothetical protein [Paraburkholderia heleia]
MSNGQLKLHRVMLIRKKSVRNYCRGLGGAFTALPLQTPAAHDRNALQRTARRPGAMRQFDGQTDIAAFKTRDGDWGFISHHVFKASGQLTHAQYTLWVNRTACAAR